MAANEKVGRERQEDKRASQDTFERRMMPFGHQLLVLFSILAASAQRKMGDLFQAPGQAHLGHAYVEPVELNL